MPAQSTAFEYSIPSPSYDTLPYRPRCEPDPLDPTVYCSAPITSDDRQGITHFFGRNKKATHTIPGGIFPLLCRTHYQEKQYRWGDNVGALAAFQCDCILKTLGRMLNKRRLDEEGLEWPYWCGFEFQTCRPPDREAQAERYFVPDWLMKLWSKEGRSRFYFSG